MHNIWAHLIITFTAFPGAGAEKAVHITVCVMVCVSHPVLFLFYFEHQYPIFLCSPSSAFTSVDCNTCVFFPHVFNSSVFPLSFVRSSAFIPRACAQCSCVSFLVLPASFLFFFNPPVMSWGLGVTHKTNCCCTSFFFCVCVCIWVQFPFSPDRTSDQLWTHQTDPLPDWQLSEYFAYLAAKTASASTTLLPSRDKSLQGNPPGTGRGVVTSRFSNPLALGLLGPS